MSALSKAQLRVLDAVRNAGPQGVTCGALAVQLGAAVGGVSQTAGSLVRRGHLAREVRGGRVVYTRNGAS